MLEPWEPQQGFRVSRRPSPFPRSSLPEPGPRTAKHQKPYRGLPQSIPRFEIHHRRHHRRTQRSRSPLDSPRNPQGTIPGMQPTNQKFNVDGTSIYRLANSKIAEEYANWNLATMMQQLRVIEIPKEARSGSGHESRQEVRSQA